MELKAKNLTVKKSLNGDSELTFTVADKDNSVAKAISENNTLKGDIRLTFIKWYNRRSLDANGYLWVLLNAISKHDDINSTAKELYKHYITKKGVYEVVPVKTEIVNSYIQRFEANGTGWICEILGKSKIKDYTNIKTYFGSSSYNTKEMKQLLDEVILDAKELGIDTITPNEKAKMLAQWEDAK